MSDQLCHVCAATKLKPVATSYVDFCLQPQWLSTVRDHHAFLNDQLPKDRNCNALLYAIGVDFRMIRWCLMNIGMSLFANGGAFHELLCHGHFPGDTDPEKFRNAFQSFTAWRKHHRIRCSQPLFKPYMRVTKGEEFCFFQSKDS